MSRTVLWGATAPRAFSHFERLLALILMCGWCGDSDTTSKEIHGAQRTIEVAATAAPVSEPSPAPKAEGGEVSPFDRSLLMCGVRFNEGLGGISPTFKGGPSREYRLLGIIQPTERQRSGRLRRYQPHGSAMARAQSRTGFAPIP